MIAEWIARRGEPARATRRTSRTPYLEDGAGAGTLTYAGLRRSTRAWADRLDRAGVPPGAGVAVRLPDPLGYATALVSILAAGRVVVPLDPALRPPKSPGCSRWPGPQAAVGDSGSGLPPGLAVLRLPDRSLGRTDLARPDAERAASPVRGPGRRDLPVHERDHRHAQGHPAARGSAVATSPPAWPPTTG